MTPHPHAEIIKAWADGHAIQVRQQTTGEWIDMHPLVGPIQLDSEYRKKPQPTKLFIPIYRLAWNDYESGNCYFSREQAEQVGKLSEHSYVKTIEVEV